MVKSVRNPSSLILNLFFVGMLIWWLSINQRGLENTNENYYFVVLQGALPVLAGILGILTGRRWGGFRSEIGKALTYTSIGLVTWGIGNLIFSYYNLFLDSEVPYPSIADAAYILSWPLWTIGIVSLFRTTGAKFGARSVYGKVILLIVPVLVAAFSYYILVIVARQGIVSTYEDSIKTFFDLAYPVGDLVILTVVTLLYSLSFRYLGGYFKWPILILLAGFAINYFGDVSFSYTTTKETYFSANWVDLIFTTAMFLIGLGVTLFRIPQEEKR